MRTCDVTKPVFVLQPDVCCPISPWPDTDVHWMT